MRKGGLGLRRRAFLQIGLGQKPRLFAAGGRVTLSQIVCLHNETSFIASRIDCLVDRKAAGIFCRLQVAGFRLKFNYNWKTAGTKNN